MNCPNCGGTVPFNMPRCPKCGGSIEQQPQQPQQSAPIYVQQAAPVYIQAPSGVSDKSKVAAALLAFFFGSLGVHRFYLGYTGIGVTQLILFVFGWGLAAVIVGIYNVP